MAANPTLSAVYVYPVKSCRGIAVTSASLDDWGLQYDRNWMVVTADGTFLTQRNVPQLALVETAIEPESLRLNAPNLPALTLPLAPHAGPVLEVVVWRDRCRAIDQGDAAAEWFSTVVGQPCRLVRIGEQYDRPVEPDYITQPAQVSFADAYPLLLISEASLADLNNRLPDALPMNRFRPNLVVSGCDPYAEDSWQRIRIGQIQFEVAKPCQRCIIPTTDQTTAIRGKEPLQTLATYRRFKGGVIFGQNLVHQGYGEVQVDALVEVLE